MTSRLRKQLLDRLGAEIDDGEGSSLRAGKFGVEIDAEGLVNGGDDFTRGDGALRGVAADVVGLADDLAAFDAAAGSPVAAISISASVLMLAF